MARTKATARKSAPTGMIKVIGQDTKSSTQFKSSSTTTTDWIAKADSLIAALTPEVDKFCKGGKFDSDKKVKAAIAQFPVATHD